MGSQIGSAGHSCRPWLPPTSTSSPPLLVSSQELGPRQQRSLVNTFPFNTQDQHHGDHHQHHQPELPARRPSSSLGSRGAKQGSEDQSVSFREVAGVSPGGDGKRCIDDVEDDIVSCETVVDEKCEDETSGYTTNTKCSKWPREVCSVSKKNVKKYTPITGCTKEPRELCAPAGCGFSQGAEECYDKTQTIVQDAPKEQCSL